MNSSSVRKLVYTALCVGLGLAMPSVFHIFGAVSGKVFLPMHIPVLLCGFVAGPMGGLACGFILPLLSSVLTGMPVLWPTAPAMALELATYGLLCGLLYHSRGWKLYPSLITAMVAGRAVSGVANAVFMGLAGNPYTLSIFLGGAFVTPIPGIIIQLVLVPALVTALSRAGLVERAKQAA